MEGPRRPGSNNRGGFSKISVEGKGIFVARNFCLMTMGRTGSTSLIHAMRPFDDIVLPSRLFPDCEDEELIHPDCVASRRAEFNRLTGVAPANDAEFVNAFYQHYADADYVGFKSMPQRHADYDRFTRRTDIFFMTLRRRDLPSMAASFQLANQRGTWRRSGEDVQQHWTFTPASMRDIDNHLRYILKSNDRLAQIPNALHLWYEDICSPDFENAGLDGFFGRPIRVARPRGSTSASSYVENWDEFRQFVNIRAAEILSQPVFIV